MSRSLVIAVVVAASMEDGELILAEKRDHPGSDAAGAASEIRHLLDIEREEVVQITVPGPDEITNKVGRAHGAEEVNICCRAMSVPLMPLDP